MKSNIVHTVRGASLRQQLAAQGIESSSAQLLRRAEERAANERALRRASVRQVDVEELEIEVVEIGAEFASYSAG